jgi:hypothetical protein
MSDVDVKKLKTPDECRTFMKNARDRNRQDLCPGAFRRLCELESGQNPDLTVVEYWQAIFALEEVHRETHGKTVRANGTRKKVKKDGVLATIESLVMSKKPGDGFRWLAEAGLGDLTAEHIVARYPAHFSAEALAASKARLEEYGIPAS